MQLLRTSASPVLDYQFSEFTIHDRLQACSSVHSIASQNKIGELRIVRLECQDKEGKGIILGAATIKTSIRGRLGTDAFHFIVKE